MLQTRRRSLDVPRSLPKDSTSLGSQPLGGAVSVQIFISYARNDDRLPPGQATGKGFVSFLHDQIEFEFQDAGGPSPDLWRDTRNIEDGDQFDPILREEIDKSDLLLVVLSQNWLQSSNCRDELAWFAQRWSKEGELAVKQRIIVACRKPVDRDERPSLLQGQTGFDFFAFDGPMGRGSLIDYFLRGDIQDKRYVFKVRDLSKFLKRRAQQISRPSEKENMGVEVPPPPTQPLDSSPPPGARKIYLAKPASDMRKAYARLVEELTHNGYAIIPDPNKNVPDDASAWNYIDSALSLADVSIHLLGKSGGFSPEAPDDSVKPLPIAQLQLARAALRSVGASGQSNGSGKEFRRIIWAPETIEDGVDPSTTNGTGNVNGQGMQPPAATTERRPDQALRLFGDFEPTDKVVGGTLSRFVDFLISHLRQSVRPGDDPAKPITKGDWVYVYHTAEDTDYAMNLMEAFQKRGVQFQPPALEGDPSLVTNIHRKRLSECSAIVLCWANATEAWAHAHADELKDWQTLGRQEKFKCRGLLTGPPPGRGKTVFVKFPPANEIDVVMNQIEDTRPLAEIIDQFISPAAHDAP